MNYEQMQQDINSSWELPQELKKRLVGFWCDPSYLSFSEMLHAYANLINDDDDPALIIEAPEDFLKRFGALYRKKDVAVECDKFVEYNQLSEYIRKKKFPMIPNWYTYYGWIRTQEVQSDKHAWFEVQRAEIITHYYNAMWKTLAVLGWTADMVDKNVMDTHSQIRFEGLVTGVPVCITVELPCLLDSTLFMPCYCNVSVGSCGGAILLYGASAPRDAVQRIFQWINEHK